VTIPVSLDNLRGRNITSYQFDVEYDPAVISPAAAVANLTGTVCEGFGLAANSPEPGRLKVVVYGVAPVSADGVYVNLRFTASGPVGSKTAFTITGFRMDDGSQPVRITSGVVEVTSANRLAGDEVSIVSPETRVDLWDLSTVRPFSLKGN
jgi:hypothetical protein